MVDIQREGAYEFNRKWFAGRLIKQVLALNGFYYWLPPADVKICVEFYQGSVDVTLNHPCDFDMYNVELKELQSALKPELVAEINDWIETLKTRWLEAEKTIEIVDYGL